MIVNIVQIDQLNLVRVRAEMGTEDKFIADWIQEVWDKGFPQVQKELFDYWNLMKVHSNLLDRVTEGRMSKTNYTWEAISEVLDEIDSQKDGETKNG